MLLCIQDKFGKEFFEYLLVRMKLNEIAAENFLT